MIREVSSENGKLFVNKKIIFEFPYEIKQVITYNDVLLVRVASPQGVIFNENVYAITFSGKLLWQIKKKDQPYQHSFYANISKIDNDTALLYNTAGWDYYVDIKTGEIIKEEFTK